MKYAIVIVSITLSSCVWKSPEPALVEIYHPKPCVEATCDIHDSTLAVKCNCKDLN